MICMHAQVFEDSYMDIFCGVKRERVDLADRSD